MPDGNQPLPPAPPVELRPFVGEDHRTSRRSRRLIDKAKLGLAIFILLLAYITLFVWLTNRVCRTCGWS